MTLDEAIEHCKEQAFKQMESGCKGCADEHLQLAKWLEELKRLRKENTDLMRDLGHFLQNCWLTKPYLFVIIDMSTIAKETT